MALSKRTRFEIFKRDGFRCTYCGANPLNATLTVKELQADHVEPKAKGGSDAPHNLVTACLDCNQGKSDVPLDEKRLRSEFASEEEREHADQIREYLRVQRDIADAKQEAEAMVLEHWEARIGDWHWTLPRYIPGALKDFGLSAVLEAVDVVARKGIGGGSAQVRYFCGVIRRYREKGVDAPFERAPSTPPARTYTENEQREKVWSAVVDCFASYWQSETREPFNGNLRELVIQATGWLPDKDEAVSKSEFFEMMKDAIYNPRLVYGDRYREKRLEHLVALAVKGEPCLPGDLEPVQYCTLDYDHDRREKAQAAACEIINYFIQEVGVAYLNDGDGDYAEKTLTDLLVDHHGELWLVHDLKLIANQSSEPTIRQIIDGLRMKLAERSSGQSYVPTSIRQWPEYQALLKAKG